MINIVLHEPEIPYNTGNIGRTCVITGASLHLIRPYGFFLNDKMIKRAGLDYWPKLDLHEYDTTEDFYKYCDALAETGKGFTNYIMVVGLCETVALFAMVFGMIA